MTRDIALLYAILGKHLNKNKLPDKEFLSYSYNNINNLNEMTQAVSKLVILRPKNSICFSFVTDIYNIFALYSKAFHEHFIW